MPWLVAGLGNPGPSYRANRHNIGFMVIDALAQLMGVGFVTKFHGRYASGRLGGERIHLLAPMTYMNRSGISLGEAVSFFKIPIERVIVVHDELDLPLGQLRIKVGGGHAGHNGLRSIFEHVGRDLVRVRCGIGRPRQGTVVDYVLGDFSAAESISLRQTIDDALHALELITKHGPLEAMNAVHPEQRAKAKTSSSTASTSGA